MRRPWVLALWAVLLVVEITGPHAVWLSLLVGLTALIGLTGWWAREMATRVTVQRSRRFGWAQVGDLLEERFTLINRSALPVLWAEIRDGSNLPGYSASRVEATGGTSVKRWMVEGICRQRGVFHLGPWEVHLGDPAGLFHVILQYPQSESFVVHPPVSRLTGIDLPKGAAHSTGQPGRRALEWTTNAAGIREYTPGDSLRIIHWPSTARAGQLIVKEFDLEPTGNLWIVLDLEARAQAGAGPESTEEYGAILAASLAHAMLEENRAVGLAALGPEPLLLPPAKGREQLWRVLRALALARAQGNDPLDQVLLRLNPSLGRGLTIVVITSSCDQAWPLELAKLERRGIIATSILLDAATFEDPSAPVPNSRLAGLTGLLADLGIGYHVVRRGYPFEFMYQRKPRGRPIYRVGATGRLIRVGDAPTRGPIEKATKRTEERVASATG